MNFEFSISLLRNEIYTYDLNSNRMIFSLQGNELDINFTDMSNEQIRNFISTYYQDIIE